jgi:small acid-soluble spore protein F (minor alpha/beta-type SASP)
MSRHRSILSEDLRAELAKEIGVYDIVQREGWGGVPSRACGNLVTAALKYAEKAFEQQNNLR